MTKNVNQQLIDNISIILKKSLSADATLADLRTHKKASFEAIFAKDAGFTCRENTFQPYVEEVANDLVEWQQTQAQTTLIALVKKIEQLFTVLGKFESNL
jgi:primosomal protein N''